MIPGERAIRLTRLSQENVSRGSGPQIECCFVKKSRKAAVRQKRVDSDQVPAGQRTSHKATAAQKTGSGGKRKRVQTPDDVESLGHYETVSDDSDGTLSGGMQDFIVEVDEEDIESDGGQDGWSYSYRPPPPKASRPQASSSRKNSTKTAIKASDDIIYLSSD